MGKSKGKNKNQQATRKVAQREARIKPFLSPATPLFNEVVEKHGDPTFLGLKPVQEWKR